MKKNILSFILGGLIFGIIGVGATYVYTARDISFLPSDENWNVTNASEAISSLKDDLNTVNNNVSEYKSNIAQTLTDNGITTNSNDSFETIDNNIDDGINNYKSQINTCNSNYSTLNTNFTNYKKGVTTALKNKGVNVTESSTLAQVQSGINGISSGIDWTNNHYLTSAYNSGTDTTYSPTVTIASGIETFMIFVYGYTQYGSLYYHLVTATNATLLSSKSVSNGYYYVFKKTDKNLSSTVKANNTQPFNHVGAYGMVAISLDS